MKGKVMAFRKTVDRSIPQVPIAEYGLASLFPSKAALIDKGIIVSK